MSASGEDVTPTEGEIEGSGLPFQGCADKATSDGPGPSLTREACGRSRGYWVTMLLHRGCVGLLLALIVWATLTDGPSAFGTIYVLVCASIVEGSWHVTRSFMADEPRARGTRGQFGSSAATTGET